MLRFSLPPLRSVKSALVCLVAIFLTIRLLSSPFLWTNTCTLYIFGGNETRNGSSTASSDSSEPIVDPSVAYPDFNLAPRRPLCRNNSLVGWLAVPFNSPSFDEIAKDNPEVRRGGMFRPRDCEPLQDRIAIIIPYRNREVHLRALLNHLHPLLQHQKLNYAVFVVEQNGSDTFNKALLMNIAFKTAIQVGAASPNPDAQFNCFIFHDVDLFSEDDRGIYRCNDEPFHLSEFIDKFNYLPWSGADVLFGGVVSIRRRLFELVNGYSNIFFGWGEHFAKLRLQGVYK